MNYKYQSINPFLLWKPIIYGEWVDKGNGLKLKCKSCLLRSTPSFLQWSSLELEALCYLFINNFLTVLFPRVTDSESAEEDHGKPNFPKTENTQENNEEKTSKIKESIESRFSVFVQLDQDEPFHVLMSNVWQKISCFMTSHKHYNRPC